MFYAKYFVVIVRFSTFVKIKYLEFMIKYQKITTMLLLLSSLTAMAVPAKRDNKLPKYKNSSLSVDERVADLVSRMTLEEKAAQMDMLRAQHILKDASTLDEEKMAHYIDSMSIGSIHDFYPKTSELSNAVQKRAIENSRLGIPIIFIEEALHGYSGVGSTTFPVPLGNATAWDTTMMHRIGKAIATESRAHGIHFILGPNLDVARDMRWGRAEETYGEDPYLGARSAVNLIKGMQGDTLTDSDAVAAEPKHFAIHGIPERGHNAASVYIGEREARYTHLYPFEKAVREAGARGIMASYNEIDGVPSSANKWLLTDVLRNEWGFKGFVVSDLGAIATQLRTHMTVATAKEAIVNSVNAGLNMQFYDFSYEEFQGDVIEAVKEGLISEETLNKSVADILRVKFELGLFDNPYTDTSLIGKVHRNAEHRALAKEAGLKSIALLQNNDNTLPFSNNVKSIALIGNLANTSSLGGYTPTGAVGVTVYEALKERFGSDVEINYINSDISSGFAPIPLNLLTPLSGKEGQKGLNIEFFGNQKFEGSPIYSAIDGNLTPFWHNLSPAPGVDNDNFSVRWKGYIDIPVSGTYEFSYGADNHGSLKIGDVMLADHFAPEMEYKTSTKSIYLEKGRQTIEVMYSEKDDYAHMTVNWRLSGTEAGSTLYSDITAEVAKSDIAIVVVGEGLSEVGEGKDRIHLSINEMDTKMIEAAAAAGKPLATVLLNGRPLLLENVAAASPALVEAWYPGESGGEAVVDVLFGDYNPAGHLTMTFPRHMGQIPCYYSKKPTSSNREYKDDSGKPLFAFGHGLSYTTFDYSAPRFSSLVGKVDDTITVSIDVTNTGERAGADVVQLYMRDKVSSVTTPMISLKGFSRVQLKPGETKTVTMELAPEHFSLINYDMKRVVEPGEFEIMIGKSSDDIIYRQTITLE